MPSGSSRRARLHVLLLPLAVACGDDVTSGADEGTASSTTTTASTGSDGGPDPTTGGSTSAATDDGADDTDTGFDPPVPTCGNGFVEEGEQCDDANLVDGDGCSADCLVPCGLEWAVVEPAPTLDSTAIGFDVASGPDDTLAVAAVVREVTADQRGNLTTLDDVVDVRTYEADGTARWSVTLASPEGSVGYSAIVVTDDGAVILATTEPDTGSGSRILVRAHEGADGGERWSSTFEGEVDDENVATGLAAVPGGGGDVVVAGRIRVAEGDNDVWLRRIAGADGAEVWTTTYSGQPNNGFSVDVGGPVAVGAGGEVFALMAEYVDFETRRATLLAYDADGNGPLWTFAPTLPGTGQAKSHRPLDVIAADGGGVIFAFERTVGAEIDFHLYALDADGAEQWSLDRDALQGRQGSSWQLRALAPLPGGFGLAGRYVNDYEILDGAWPEIWLSRFDAAGREQCRVGLQAEGRGLIPPSLDPRSIAAATDTGLVVSGERILDGESSTWLGRFRPL